MYGGLDFNVPDIGIAPQAPGLMALRHAEEENARREALAAEIEAALAGQRMQNVDAGSQVFGRLVGTAARPKLRPLAQYLRKGVVRGAKSIGNALFNAATPAATGVEVADEATEAIEAARAALVGVPAAAPAATPAAAPAAQAGTSLLGNSGQILGAGAALYGGYKGIEGGLENISDLRRAIGTGDLSPQEEEAARQKTFNSGMVNMGIGSVGGALGGSSYGPIGAALGALVGGSGGALQATKSYGGSEGSDWQNTLRASLKFAKNPFKR